MNLDQALDYARHHGLSDRDLVDVVRTAAEARRQAVTVGDVALQHPDLDGRVIYVPAGAVETHEASGWVQAQADTEQAAEDKPKPRARKAN